MHVGVDGLVGEPRLCVVQMGVGRVGLTRRQGEGPLGGTQLILGPSRLLGKLRHVGGAGVDLGGDAGCLGALVLDRTGGAGTDGCAGRTHQHGEGETCPDKVARCRHLGRAPPTQRKWGSASDPTEGGLP